MIYKHICLMVVGLGCSLLAKAQDKQQTTITYNLAAETAIGTGDFTAFQLTSNRHDILATRSNTGYMRGAVNVEHSLGNGLILSGAVDFIGSSHANHKNYLQQCYANLSYQDFFLEFGTREQQQAIRDDLLSTGSFVKGTNAKPFLQFHIGTNGFWTVPFTKDWIQINFDGGYGRFLDSNYREEAFYRGDPGKGKNINTKYATGIYMHQKHLYIRTNPKKRIFGLVGIEHMVQFGGTLYRYNSSDGTIHQKEKSSDLKAFFDVILPFGDSKFYEHDALEDWIFGNHVGMMTAQIGWNINNDNLLQAYLDNPFEDGSGIRKGNGFDGLWGLQYNNKASDVQYVRGAVIEYLQTTNQSGPLHYDSRDYPVSTSGIVIGDYVTGNDDYYNHAAYDSYTHFGLTPGNPLIASPIYNKGGYTAYSDNRIKAWHFGVNGELTKQLSYLVKGSYQEGWGTYHAPLPTKHHSFDAMLQGTYTTGPWQISAAYAFDKGNIYGDNSTFDLKIAFHGKIL